MLLMLLYKVLRQLRFVAHATLLSTKTIKVCIKLHELQTLIVLVLCKVA